jgi:hypothetical protein
MIPLSAPLPLRTTAAWAGYREAAIIPHRYGISGGALLQYDRARTVFVWADHAVTAVDEVTLGGQPVGNWAARNGTDIAGRVVAFVEFDQPVPDNVELIARGRGKRDRLTGALLDSPADVVRDILRLAGRDLPAGALGEFRAACRRAGITVGGSIDTEVSARAAVQELCASIGAVWAPDATGLCRLWPGAELPAALVTVDRRHGLSASCDAAALVTDLTLRYRHEDRNPRAAVQLQAPDAIASHGLRPATHDAPWIAEARVAIAVAERLLAQQARPQWRARAEGLTRALRVGDAVRLDHPVLPLGGDALVLGSERSAESGLCAIEFAVTVGDVPVTRIVQLANALDPEQAAPLPPAPDGTAAQIRGAIADARGTPDPVEQVSAANSYQVRPDSPPPEPGTLPDTGNEGDFLRYYAATSWVPSTAGFNDLTDTAADGAVLRYRTATGWAGEGLDLAELADTDIDTPVAGDLLAYDGTDWINKGPFAPVVVVAGSRTAQLSDAGSYLRFTSGTAVNLTIPPQSSVAWRADSAIEGEQGGSGKVTIVAGSGVTVNVATGFELASREAFSVFGLKRTAENVWTLFGDLEQVP